MNIRRANVRSRADLLAFRQPFCFNETLGLIALSGIVMRNTPPPIYRRRPHDVLNGCCSERSLGVTQRGREITQHVSFGSLADISAWIKDVRFTRASGRQLSSTMRVPGSCGKLSARD
jgi:hypothetical protein